MSNDYRDAMYIGPSPALFAGEPHLNVAFGPTSEWLSEKANPNMAVGGNTQSPTAPGVAVTAVSLPVPAPSRPIP